MRVPLIAASSNAAPVHLIAAQEWAGWSEARSDFVRALARMQDFKAQAGRSLIVPGTDGSCERVAFGLGAEPAAMLAGTAARDLPAGDYQIAGAPAGLDPTLLATAWALGGYGFERYKARPKGPARLAAPPGADLEEAVRQAEAVYLARDLVNTPAGDMGPEALHAEAEAIAAGEGAAFTAIVGEALLAEGFPLIHMVGRAAREAPRLLHLVWGDVSAPVVCLVGKGITFDTGGLDLKTGGGMRLMKKDMGGAAVALALGRLAMRAGLKVRLHVILAVAENAVGAGAFRPGDVARSRGGLTVEVDNTDAEGRLVLADALAFAEELKPALMIDFATLTGAARTALGPDIAPFFTDDEGLAGALAKAGAAAEDPLWRLPLWAPYAKDMDSPIADLKNTGEGAFAGAIYGGLFLKRFVKTPAWAHFDIYAWTPKDKPGRPAGGDAPALRAVWRVLKERYGAGG